MKKLIEKLNLTIKEFAKLYEIPYNTVRQWYNESRQAPPYIKKIIEEIINLKSKGEQLTFLNDQEKNYDEYRYLVKIIHIPTKTTIYTRVINYNEYIEFEKNYWYVEYIKNKTGYKVKYYLLHDIN